jgi:hypothetical protein
LFVEIFAIRAHLPYTYLEADPRDDCAGAEADRQRTAAATILHMQGAVGHVLGLCQPPTYPWTTRS